MNGLTASLWKYRKKDTLHRAVSFNRTKEEMRSHDKNKRDQRERRGQEAQRETAREKTIVLDCGVSELTEPASCGSEEILLVLYLCVDGRQRFFFFYLVSCCFVPFFTHAVLV